MKTSPLRTEAVRPNDDSIPVAEIITADADPAPMPVKPALAAWCAMQAALCTSGVAGTLRKLARKEEGVTTAEYVVVLLAAVGFASLLLGILKSDSMKKTLTNLIMNALNIS